MQDRDHIAMIPGRATLSDTESFQTTARKPAFDEPVRTDTSKANVVEALHHVTIHAGVPRANHALKLAKQTYAEMETQASHSQT